MADVQRSSSYRILVIVEGPCDRSVVRGIFENLKVEHEARLLRGDSLQKASRLAIALGGQYDKVLIVKDLHERDEGKLRLRLESMESTLRSALRREVKAIIMRRSVESVLLADPDALCDVTGCTVDVANPDQLPDPAEMLRETLAKCKRQHHWKSPRIYYEVAKRLDVDRASARSQSLADLLKAARDWCSTGQLRGLVP